MPPFIFQKQLIDTHEYYESKLPSIAYAFHRIGCYSALNKGKPLLAEDKKLCDKLTTQNVEMYERIWKYDLPEDF